MDDKDALAQRFEEHRHHLRAVAYRMLGSLGDAEDAVQESWFRLSRSDAGEIHNLGGWLTTVVGRVCLDMLRSRESRREDPMPDRLPDPILTFGDDPEQEALTADSVGLALMVVLQELNPAERLAFVLHDMFSVSFDEIARILDRTPAATRQLASRARRRVQGAAVPDSDVAGQRRVVDAFLSAARVGDFESLVALLAPDVLLRAEMAGTLTVIKGAAEVAARALMFRTVAQDFEHVLVNGAAGLMRTVDGRMTTVGVYLIRDGLIVEIDIWDGADRLSGL
ncbi:sigma-70 family RNA polymerase sigma factor [Nonomuraea longicatena]|uniref:RNA polymerase sigma factor SigJ n=1 Tax=Nonomuraea longicatena TaxID=83682 RepID=A0ABP3ZMX0_9ACTN